MESGLFAPPAAAAGEVFASMLEKQRERAVLHSDLNSFFASVECMLDPRLSDYAVAVCGSTEERHGIVLAKNQRAKRAGVKTGQTTGEAQAQCPGLVTVSPHYGEYEKVSRQVRKIYESYTDLVEGFGIDECWLDVTGSTGLFGSPAKIADEIRARVLREVGVTVSVGVSFTKSFAKLGSDLRKPDAVTEIPYESFREKIWGLPADALIGVGRSSRRALWLSGIRTIGDIALRPPEYLDSSLGKCGRSIWLCANGLDISPVLPADAEIPPKSVGHGSTEKRDLRRPEEIERELIFLSQDVGTRLRRHRLAARCCTLSVRDSTLECFDRSRHLPSPTQSASRLAAVCYSLFMREYGDRPFAVRTLTLRASDLVPDSTPSQLDIFSLCDEEKSAREARADLTADSLRERYGAGIILPAACFLPL